MNQHTRANAQETDSLYSIGAILEALNLVGPTTTSAFPRPVSGILTSDIECDQNGDGNYQVVHRKGETVQVGGLAYDDQGHAQRYFLAGEPDHTYSLATIDVEALADAIDIERRKDEEAEPGDLGSFKPDPFAGSHQANGNY